ncbi:hypothetical protein VPH35_049998 [Triticum aestivum]
MSKIGISIAKKPKEERGLVLVSHFFSDSLDLTRPPSLPYPQRLAADAAQLFQPRDFRRAGTAPGPSVAGASPSRASPAAPPHHTRGGRRRCPALSPIFSAWIRLRGFYNHKLFYFYMDFS